MKLFVRCQRNGSECYMAYQGLDQSVVMTLLTQIGATAVVFITEDVWKAATATENP